MTVLVLAAAILVAGDWFGFDGSALRADPAYLLVRLGLGASASLATLVAVTGRMVR